MGIHPDEFCSEIAYLHNKATVKNCTFFCEAVTDKSSFYSGMLKSYTCFAKRGLDFSVRAIVFTLSCGVKLVSFILRNFGQENISNAQ